MPTYVKVGGAWKLATVWNKVGGVWKANNPSVKVGGTWRSVTASSITVNADWGGIPGSGAFQTSADRTLTVPGGSPGTITFTIGNNTGTLQYRKNGGGYTGVTNTTITVANGDTITFRFSGSSGQDGDVTVTDATTGGFIGAFQGLHT